MSSPKRAPISLLCVREKQASGRRQESRFITRAANSIASSRTSWFSPGTSPQEQDRAENPFTAGCSTTKTSSSSTQSHSSCRWLIAERTQTHPSSSCESLRLLYAASSNISVSAVPQNLRSIWMGECFWNSIHLNVVLILYRDLDTESMSSSEK